MRDQAEEKSDCYPDLDIEKPAFSGAASLGMGWFYILACSHSTSLC